MSEERTATSAAFDKLFAFDKRIRFCGLLSPSGTLLEGRMRKDTTPLEPKTQEARLAVQIALAVHMDKSWDKYFGKTKSIAIFKERVIFCIFSLAEYVLVVAMEPDLPVSKRIRLGEVVDTTDFGIS